MLWDVSAGGVLLVGSGCGGIGSEVCWGYIMSGCWVCVMG